MSLVKVAKMVGSLLMMVSEKVKDLVEKIRMLKS